jgi:hypothetical protein
VLITRAVFFAHFSSFTRRAILQSSKSNGGPIAKVHSYPDG